MIQSCAILRRSIRFLGTMYGPLGAFPGWRYGSTSYTAFQKGSMSETRSFKTGRFFIGSTTKYPSRSKRGFACVLHDSPVRPFMLLAHGPPRLHGEVPLVVVGLRVDVRVEPVHLDRGH